MCWTATSRLGLSFDHELFRLAASISGNYLKLCASLSNVGANAQFLPTFFPELSRVVTGFARLPPKRGLPTASTSTVGGQLSET